MTKYKNKCDRKNVFLKEEFQLINVQGIREIAYHHQNTIVKIAPLLTERMRAKISERKN